MVTMDYWKWYCFSAGGYIFGLLGQKKVQREKTQEKKSRPLKIPKTKWK